MILNFFNLFISEIRFNGLVGVALRPPPVADKGSKALSEIMSKRQHIYVQRIATIFRATHCDYISDGRSLDARK